MLKVVLDTNVIISGTIMDHGVSFQILKSWENGEFILIISEPILQEIDRVFHYSHIKDKRGLSEEHIKDVLYALKTYSLNTSTETKIEAISDDPDDDKFIVAAVEGEADYIVSGDRHLRGIEHYHGIRVISPAEFMKML
jgi:putative PIN family toxin of toxin-antitoxin system